MKKKSLSIISIFFKVLKDIFSFNASRSIGVILFLAISSFNGFIFLEFIDFITLTATQVYNGEILSIYTIAVKTSLFLLALLATTSIAQYYSIFKIKYSTIVSEHLNTNIKKKLGTIDYEYFESSIVYEKLHRVNAKIVEGYNSAVESVAKILEIVFYIVLYMLYLSKINIVFAALVVLSIVVSGIIATKMSKSKHKILVDITRLNQKRDYLDQLPKDKITHQEYKSGRLFSSIFDTYTKAYNAAQAGYLQIHKYTIFAEAKALLLFVATMFFSYVYLSFQIRSGTISVGILISLMIIFDTLYSKSEALSY